MLASERLMWWQRKLGSARDALAGDG